MPLCRRLVVVLCAALLLCAGCAQKRKPYVKKPGKPWIAAKSLCMLPMARPPQSADPAALAEVIEAGWKARLEVPRGAQVVHIHPGPRAGSYDSITIDLSDARVDPERKQKVPKPQRRSQGWVTAERLEFFAHPLVLDRAKVKIDITAADATLDVRRNRRDGKPLLTLTDAREGTLSLEVKRRDMDWLLLHALRSAAGRFGVAVDRTKLKLDVVGDRTITVDLKVDTRVALLPAGFRFRARVDLDDRLNGTMTHLSCEGDQLLGPIISTFIQPAIKKYEGQTRPIVAFDWGKMKLRDVDIRVEETVRVTAKFGSGGPAPAEKQRHARRRG